MVASAESNEEGGKPASKGAAKKRGATRRPAPRSARTRREKRPDGPGPARLYALLAGAFLALLGVLGFFYDATFGTGDTLTSDDLAGILMVNGWRNVVYLVTGLLALGLAARWPRRTALGLGLFYLLFAVWGFAETERGIGDLLGAIPLGDNDNVLHLILGVLGLGAALVDGPLPRLPERAKPRKPKALRARPRPAAGERPKSGSEPAGEPKSRPKAKPKPEAGGDRPAKKRELPRPRPAGTPRPSSSS